MNDEPARQTAPRRVRWWPAGLILSAALIALAKLWIVPPVSQQKFNMDFASIVGIAFILLFLWLMLFSRTPWRTRWAAVGLLIGSVVLLFGLFRIHGVSGNLVPILEPRWAHHEVQKAISNARLTPSKPPPGAADFPQFLGPTRDGRLTGPILATNWSGQPPMELWRMPVGAGWSGFAVSGAAAITQEQRGEDECVIAYDLTTGKVLWSHADKRHYADPLAGEGPRATPTISGQRVLALGATGLLNCLDLADGHAFWSRDVFVENGATIAAWGEAISPLVENGLVVVSVGGAKETALVAYNVADGTPAWSGGKQSAGYSSPVAATLAGTRQILLFADALTGSDATTGKELWQFPWPGGHPHVTTPIIIGDSDVIISSGYGTGSARVRIARAADGRWSAKQVWRANRMKAKFTNLILDKGYIYGLDDGILECVDAATGAFAWKDGRYGHGQILMVGEILVVMAEDGEVVLVDPRPDQLRELTRFPALTGKTWNPPALAGEFLLVRNDKEAACFRMPVRK